MSTDPIFCKVEIWSLHAQHEIKSEERTSVERKYRSPHILVAVYDVVVPTAVAFCVCSWP